MEKISLLDKLKRFFNLLDEKYIYDKNKSENQLKSKEWDVVRRLTVARDVRENELKSMLKDYYKGHVFVGRSISNEDCFVGLNVIAISKDIDTSSYRIYEIYQD